MVLLCTYINLVLTGRQWSTCDSATRGWIYYKLVWHEHVYHAHTFPTNACSCQTGTEDFIVRGVWTSSSPYCIKPCIKAWNSSLPLTLWISDMVEKKSSWTSATLGCISNLLAFKDICFSDKIMSCLHVLWINQKFFLWDHSSKPTKTRNGNSVDTTTTAIVKNVKSVLPQQPS